MSIAYESRISRPGVPARCEKCWNMRSRATHEFEYSPGGGVVGVSSVAPPPVTGTNGYTQAVEKATMRECANRSATIAGTSAFIAQVRCSAPLDPNLRPAMNTTFGAAGRRDTAARSSRSHSIAHAAPSAPTAGPAR
jgi:hypothetical protein